MYRRALELDPEDPSPYLYLGALHHRLKRYQEAEAVLLDGHRRFPEDPDILNGLGYLYADWNHRLDRAVVLIEQALAQDPHNGNYLDSLGWAFFRMGRLSESLMLLEEAVRISPQPEIFEHLGQVYLRLGMVEAARSAWENGLRRIGPEEWELRNLFHSHLERLKRKDRQRR
jgi:tetratricopeptide (TPR) repeat protein